LVEEIKNRYGDLHQQNSITNMTMVDVYEPIYFGLETVKLEKQVTAYECVLSRKPIDENHLGYQPAKPRRTAQNKPRDDT
jgi:hypothetical protein